MPLIYFVYRLADVFITFIKPPRELTGGLFLQLRKAPPDAARGLEPNWLGTELAWNRIGLERN